MAKQLTILVAPMDGVGHTNATIGIAQCLKDRGHRVVYVIGSAFAGQLAKYGFEEELLISEETVNSKPGESGAEVLKTLGILSNKSSFEKMKVFSRPDFYFNMIDKKIKTETQIKSVMDKCKPDIVIVSDVIASPCLIGNDKPWVRICSANPLFYLDMDDDRTPPIGSGFASNSNKSTWTEFNDTLKNFNKAGIAKYNNWTSQYNLPAVTSGLCVPRSPYLNVYGFPKELDYTDLRPLPANEKWVSVDAFTRREAQEFDIPDQLKDRDTKSQKLILFSLGSIASAEDQLMQRLIDILAKTRHKYIVSKGVNGDRLRLADNMWGQNSVPQTKVLPIVDLVITHGGNNTITETFGFGKPMIVMPLWGDQYDNAQRVLEKGFGLRLEPYSCTERELIDGIDRLLNDNQMKLRLKEASNRIEREDSIGKVSDQIEQLVK